MRLASHALASGPLAASTHSARPAPRPAATRRPRHHRSRDPGRHLQGRQRAHRVRHRPVSAAVSVGGCRAAVVDQSGARTQLAGLVGAGLVAVLLLFINGLLADLPQTALASVVITTALSLMDLGVLRRYAQVRTSALTVSLVAAVGVILLGCSQGSSWQSSLPSCCSFAETGGPTALSSARCPRWVGGTAP
jgi:hypothetical protein